MVERDDIHTHPLPGPRPLRRAVGRAIGGNQNLQPVSGVVERGEVCETRVDPRGLVVGHDDQRDGRLPPLTGHRPGPKPRPEADEGRIAQEGVGQEEDRSPEEELDDSLHVGECCGAALA